MMYEPIAQLAVENYGCIRDASFTLSPLHAFIGPNDSGKSTALRALRTVAQFAAGTFSGDYASDAQPFDPRMAAASLLGVQYADGLCYQLTAAAAPHVITERVHGGEPSSPTAVRLRGRNVPGLLQGGGSERPEDAAPLAALAARLAPATLVRFDPDCLRAPAPLLPESAGIAFADERGTGLPSVYDAIMNRDTDAFAALQTRVRALFPTVARLGLINVSSTHKELAVTLVDGTRVGARAMSEGLLYYLAFAALRHVESARLLLVEEPENGLHPARIAEVMRVLRELSTHGQVVIATHSPLVVNELEGHEISVLTRDPEKGTQAVLLKDVPGFDDAMKVYQPGEFWLSYCDGQQEAPLLDGRPRL